MKTTIKNLLQIEGSSIEEEDYDYLTLDVYKKDDFKIKYTYNSKFNNWHAILQDWNYDEGFIELSLKVFYTIEGVINQIYYITGEKKQLPTKISRKLKLETINKNV